MGDCKLMGILVRDILYIVVWITILSFVFQCKSLRRHLDKYIGSTEHQKNQIENKDIMNESINN